LALFGAHWEDLDISDYGACCPSTLGEAAEGGGRSHYLLSVIHVCNCSSYELGACYPAPPIHEATGVATRGQSLEGLSIL
jgi:hypothetical protein